MPFGVRSELKVSWMGESLSVWSWKRTRLFVGFIVEDASSEVIFLSLSRSVAERSGAMKAVDDDLYVYCS